MVILTLTDSVRYPIKPLTVTEEDGSYFLYYKGKKGEAWDRLDLDSVTKLNGVEVFDFEIARPGSELSTDFEHPILRIYLDNLDNVLKMEIVKPVV